MHRTVFALLDSETFSKDAMERYRTLPDEQNPLYTRRYVSIDPGKLANVDLANGHRELLNGFLSRLRSATNIGFDAIISESGLDTLSERGGVLSYAQFGTDLYSKLLGETSFSSASDRQAALIHATARGILKVDVPSESDVSLKLLFVNVGASLPERLAIDVRKGSRLRLFEWHASIAPNACFSGILRDVNVHNGAECGIDILHNENMNTSIIEGTIADAMADSRLSVNYVYVGGSATRAKNTLKASGHASRISATEMAIASKRQRMDLNTSVVNTASASEVRLASRAVAMHESLCYLKGFAGISEGARDTRSFVEEHGMLMGGSAKISAIPSMAISENLVRATHASTVGPIDPEVVFYLTSKGISEPAARHLLVTGFFSAPISSIEEPVARETASSVMIGKIRREGEHEDAPNISPSDTVWGERTGAPPSNSLERHYKYRSEV